MNWGDIPQHMLDETAQLRHAQENLTRTVNAEIDRRVHQACLNWRFKMATVLRERETIRAHLELGHPDVALAKIRLDDAEWFRTTSPTKYIDALEDCPLDIRPPA